MPETPLPSQRTPQGRRLPSVRSATDLGKGTLVGCLVTEFVLLDFTTKMAYFWMLKINVSLIPLSFLFSPLTPLSSLSLSPLPPLAPFLLTFPPFPSTLPLFFVCACTCAFECVGQKTVFGVCLYLLSFWQRISFAASSTSLDSPHFTFLIPIKHFICRKRILFQQEENSVSHSLGHFRAWWVSIAFLLFPGVGQWCSSFCPVDVGWEVSLTSLNLSGYPWKLHVEFLVFFTERKQTKHQTDFKKVEVIGFFWRGFAIYLTACVVIIIQDDYLFIANLGRGWLKLAFLKYWGKPMMKIIATGKSLWVGVTPGRRQLIVEAACALSS